MAKLQAALARGAGELTSAEADRTRLATQPPRSPSHAQKPAPISGVGSAVRRGEGTAAGYELACRIHEGHHDQAVERQVAMRVAFGSAEFDGFRHRAGDVEGAEHPVPQRQVGAEVLVKMPRRIAVVNLTAAYGSAATPQGKQ